MTYLLLTSKEGVAQLLNLDLPRDQNALRNTFEDVAHGQDTAWDGLYVIDPKINHGAPTLCQTKTTTTKFDSDDYADATVVIVVPRDGGSPIVHQFGYRIDGRS